MAFLSQRPFRTESCFAQTPQTDVRQSEGTIAVTPNATIPTSCNLVRDGCACQGLVVPASGLLERDRSFRNRRSPGTAPRNRARMATIGKCHRQRLERLSGLESLPTSTGATRCRLVLEHALLSLALCPRWRRHWLQIVGGGRIQRVHYASFRVFLISTVLPIVSHRTISQLMAR